MPPASPLRDGGENRGSFRMHAAVAGEDDGYILDVSPAEPFGVLGVLVRIPLEHRFAAVVACTGSVRRGNPDVQGRLEYTGELRVKVKATLKITVS